MRMVGYYTIYRKFETKRGLIMCCGAIDHERHLESNFADASVSMFVFKFSDAFFTKLLAATSALGGCSSGRQACRLHGSLLKN
ncbi:hypothetical protein DAI22_11g220800 [Oryza sativa Japonica Group]|nr:hypothetical protein DAI22_11g220800 [Oryza sativa Japonica Group]